MQAVYFSRVNEKVIKWNFCGTPVIGYISTTNITDKFVVFDSIELGAGYSQPENDFYFNGPLINDATKNNLFQGNFIEFSEEDVNIEN